MGKKTKDSEITHWNYRVVQHNDMPEWTSDMAIHEAYYEDDGEISVTEGAVGVWGSTIGELRDVLRAMLLALDKPVLDYDNLEGANDEPTKEKEKDG